MWVFFVGCDLAFEQHYVGKVCVCAHACLCVRESGRGGGGGVKCM